MTSAKKPKLSNLLAVVRVRGKINLNHGLKRTFESLNLHNKNWCVVLKDTPSNRGMVLKLKDYVTYGEITPTFFEELIKKRGELFKEPQTSESKKYFEFEKKKYQRYFRLSPPIKGYGRNGIKVGFAKGGALGNRADKITDLIKRMI
jgi:large subunit ribosomal protein L30